MGAMLRQHRFELFVMSVACTVSSFESRVQLNFAAFDGCTPVFESVGRIAVYSALFAAPVRDVRP